MSREILFRGKMGKGDWIYGCYVLTPDDGPVIMTCADWGGKFSHPVIPATVGQFTGLCDKNGVKIFEGDKVESSCGEIGIIEYLEEDGMFIISFPITLGHSSWIATFGDFDGNEMEVIGNIHDNFELLKEESV
jgi:hypothetical protein